MEVFYALGWDQHTWAEIPTAPLGTPEQRRVALAGLKDDALTAYEMQADGTYGWESDELLDRRERLAIFGIRQGVTASRGAELAWYLHGAHPDALVAAAIERGEAFSRALVRRLCVAANRFGALKGSTFAAAVVRIGEHFALPVSTNTEYLRDVAVVAAQAFGRLGRNEELIDGIGTLDELRPRFEQLITAAISVGIPSEGAVTRALSGAIERGWLTRDRVIDMAIAGLDAAAKQNERRGWVAFLSAELTLTDDELRDRVDALLPAFTSGDGPLAKILLVRAISLVDNAALPDLALAGSTVKARAVKAAVIAAFAARPMPADADVRSGVAETFEPAVFDSDPQVARAAERLWAAWDLGAAPTGAGAESLAWRPTPPLWDLPRFNAPTGGLDELLQLTSELLARRAEHVDIVTERFLVLANTVAATDPEALRVAWRGVGRTRFPGLAAVWNWTNGHMHDALVDTSNYAVTPLDAREGAVFARLGSLPVLLSTPTWDDLRIDPADLLARLQTYERAGMAAAEGDLFAAVMRTDPALATRELIAAFGELAVTITGRDGTVLAHTAGDVVASWLAEPLAEPAVELRNGQWRARSVSRIPAFDALPRRIHGGSHDRALCPEALPWWGAAADRDLHDGRGVHDFSVRAGQRARSAAPLGSGFAANLLYAAAASPARDRDGIAVAAIDAFERGLLVPGEPDPALLSWQSEPLRLAAFATGAEGLVADGLLSVLWPFFDAVLLRSDAAPRPFPGTAEVADFLLAHAADVRVAVAEGRAPASALDVPGLRAFAARAGGARAPRAARLALEVVGVATPPVVRASEAVVATTALNDAEFADAWRLPAGAPPYIVDDAQITVVEAESERVEVDLGLDVTLPAEPEWTYRIHKIGWYDLSIEGQSQALRRGADGVDERAYLRWDAEGGHLIAERKRDWRGDTADAPVAGMRGGDVPPWTVTHTAAALTLVLHAGARGDDGIGALSTLVGRGLAHPDAVRDAVRTLYASDLVVPTRLTRMLDQKPETIATLWPVLTEAFRAAADAPKPPRWLARVTDTAIGRASILAEATRRGHIPREAWEPLTRLAARSGATTGLVKARSLDAALGQ